MKNVFFSKIHMTVIIIVLKLIIAIMYSTKIVEFVIFVENSER